MWTCLGHYKGRSYHIEAVGGKENQYIAYVAYPFTNMFTFIVGNAFGFKALRALRLEDLRIANSPRLFQNLTRPASRNPS